MSNPSCSSWGISTCYGSWQEQHGEPALYCSFGCSFEETKVENSNNRSYISYSAYAEYDDDSALFYGTTRSNAGTLRIYVNGSLVASKAVPMEYNYTDHHTDLCSLSGGCWVTHNNDGSKSITCQIKLDEGSDPRGAGFYWRYAYGNKASMTLTSIPKANTVSVSPQNFVATGESSLTITVNGSNTNAAGHTLIITVGHYTQIINVDGGTSLPFTRTWTPSKDIIKQIQYPGKGGGGGSSRSKANLVAKVECRTLINPSLYYSSTANFVFSASETASASIAKSGSKITFNLNGVFFNFDGLFGDRIPLASKVVVAMNQNGSMNLLPYIEIDRITLSKETWNQMVSDDVVSVDTEEASIRKNGSLNHRLGALGNDYETFTLKPGMNYIQCLNSDWVETAPEFKLKYREVFL